MGMSAAGILLGLSCCGIDITGGGTAAGDCCGTNGDDGGVSRFWSASKRSLPLMMLEFIDDDSDGVDAMEGSMDDELLGVVVYLPRESLNLGCRRPLLDVARVLLCCYAALLICCSASACCVVGTNAAPVTTMW
jgi:hypothetical protein